LKEVSSDEQPTKPLVRILNKNSFHFLARRSSSSTVTQDEQETIKKTLFNDLVKRNNCFQKSMLKMFL